MIFLRTIISITIFLSCVSSSAFAGKRVALVIGNGSYANAPALANPKNDAADMAASLESLGFTVIVGIDLTKTQMDRKILEFSSALSGADAGVFHYSGHGLQVAGVNYLVPIDAELTTTAALDFEMVRLDLVQRTMEREAKTNILFLDACRNNPLARNLARTLGTRSVDIGHGLAPAESGAGTLISFSTQPGNVALDGTERNSPYSGPLAKAIGTPGEDILSILTAVRNEVMAATNEKQVPWENHALRAKFYFAPVQPAQTKAQAFEAQTPLTEVTQVWSQVKDSDDPKVLEAFRRQYGATNGVFDALAAQRIEKLEQVSAAIKVMPKLNNTSEADALTGTWIGVLSQPGVRDRMNASFEITGSEKSIEGRFHLEVLGYPDRFVTYVASGNIKSLEPVAEEEGNPPGGGGTYWCRTGTLQLALQPDGTLRASGEGKPDCKHWTMTLHRMRAHEVGKH